MRELIVQVPRGRGAEVVDAAREQGGVNLARWEAESAEGPADVVLVHLPNAGVEGFMAAVDTIPEHRITLKPRGVVPLRPPADEAPDQATQVEERSPVEVYLSGLQSVGSWKGFLGYAAVAGLVVWVGLLTETIYLLVAAMLIAPFAGPAMNAAIATARGDATLLARTLARYFAALAVTIGVSAALTWAWGLSVPTRLMVDVASVSAAAVILPVAAGAAGGLQLVQPERKSLVSGAAVGLLVAASLAPPAGLIGMGAVLGAWDMVKASAFLLLLQLAGINLTGALVFRYYGRLTPRGARYPRGRRGVAALAATATVLVLAALLAWQAADAPDLTKASVAEAAVTDARDAVDASGLARFVDAEARFARGDVEGRDVLLLTVYAERSPDADASAEEVRDALTRAVRERVQARAPDVTALVDVVVLAPPDA